MRHQRHANRLLASISQRSRRHLLSQSSEVALSANDVLHEPNAHPAHAFFLTSGVASILALTTEGPAGEVAMVGREGFIGSFHLIGPVPAPTHCRMQLAGAAVRVPFDHLRDAFQQNDDVHQRVLEFVQAQAHTLSQIAGCHRTHGASQRLTRWLLHAQDLAESSNISITQATLSELLGTKRVTIVAAAAELQRQKLIHYRRGHIHIVNRKKLEAIVCDCYSTARDIHRNLYH